MLLSSGLTVVKYISHLYRDNWKAPGWLAVYRTSTTASAVLPCLSVSSAVALVRGAVTTGQCSSTQIQRRLSASFAEMWSSSRASTSSPCSKGRPNLQTGRAHYRIVIMGAAAVGKSAIISQFLYDRFVKEYKATVEDLHRGEYDVNGMHMTLDILDTSGTHSFPAMRKLAIATGDAFVLVYSVDDDSSFSAVKELREEIMTEKNSEDVPIVVAANKTDVETEKRMIGRETAETLVCIEWGNGYIEASAKDNINIVGIFKEILRQSNVQYALSPAVRRRRRSMPAVLVQRRQLDPPKRHSCSLN